MVADGADDGLEPLGALEPPVAEEIGVEEGAEDGRGWRGTGRAGRAAGFGAGCCEVRGERVCECVCEGAGDELDEVAGVLADALGGLLGIVGMLAGDVDGIAGDLPVAMAAGEAFFVEVEVTGIAGIAVFGGPDLGGGLGIAGKDGGWGKAAFGDGGRLVAAGIDVERMVERTGGAGCASRILSGVLDQVGIGEEEVDAGGGESLLDADAVEGGGSGGAFGGDRVLPEAGGTVAALGRPEAARGGAEVAAMRGDAGADLGEDALVGAEQRQVAVGGAGGDEADEAGGLEAAEAGDEVAVERVEVFEGLGEEVLPVAGEVSEVLIARLPEVGLVFAGGADLAAEIAGELAAEGWVGELFEEDGREAEVAVQGEAVALEVGEDAEERQVGLGGGIVEPLGAVGPGAVVDDPGEMGVEGEREKGVCSQGRWSRRRRWILRQSGVLWAWVRA